MYFSLYAYINFTKTLNYADFCSSSKAPLAVYKDTASGDQTESDKSKPEFGSLLMLGGRGERNKENNALPGK